jgi:signal transduction histidine kinase
MLPLHTENRRFVEPNSSTPAQLGLAQGSSNIGALANATSWLIEQAPQRAIIEERQRLARDLHDSTMQSLYSIILYADAAIKMQRAGKAEIAGERLHQIHDLANETLNDMRAFVFDLHPLSLEQEGLVASLQARLKAVETRIGIQTELVSQGELRLPMALAEELYHIAQEALNNVLRHAHARRVMVRLRSDPERTCLEVCDDGVGYVPEVGETTGGFRLRGMRARADRIGGELAIESAPGEGTTVRVSVRTRGGKSREQELWLNEQFAC